MLSAQPGEGALLCKRLKPLGTPRYFAGPRRRPVHFPHKTA